MHPSGADTVLVRHGDVGVKSRKVQTEMEKRLRDNIAAILGERDIDAEVERQWSRLLVHTSEGNVEDATTAAADTFGVQSASPAVVVSPEQETIEATLADAAREHYDGGTFAVRARRAAKDHPFTSTELEREGGTAVWNAVENPEVDLDDPDITFYVEVRDSDAFVFLEKRDGPGGLPLGTQTKLVSLVSGGIDSPVATWEVMKRGSPIIPIYLDLGDYGGIDHQARAIETVRKLARYAPNQDMRVRKVPAGEAMNLLGEEVGPARMLVFRRFMYRVAEHIAARNPPMVSSPAKPSARNPVIRPQPRRREHLDEHARPSPAPHDGQERHRRPCASNRHVHRIHDSGRLQPPRTGLPRDERDPRNRGQRGT